MTNWLLKLLVVSVFLCDVSRAAPIYGVDVLGLAKQDVKMIASTLPRRTALGVLEGTFGNAVKSVDRILKTKKLAAFRIHLGNGSCIRLKKCFSGEIDYKDLTALGKRAFKYNKLAVKYPESKCYLSPFLEYDTRNRKVINAWIEVLKNKAPNCAVVLNPNLGYVPKGVLRERHTTNKRASIISTDGQNIFTITGDLRKRYANELFLAWIPSFNLRHDREFTFTPPKLRTKKTSRQELIRVYSRSSTSNARRKK